MKNIFFTFFFYNFIIGSVIDVQIVDSELIITCNNEDHVNYGLSYPVTYMLKIDSNLDNLKAYKKNLESQSWSLMSTKVENDFFNGEEVVRFDYQNGITYVSVGFSIISDTIIVKLVNNFDEKINISFQGISEYYDNRKAAVTITGDDWADWCNQKFIQACQNFRSYNLWYSVGVITAACNNETWEDIQNEVDNGLVEVLSHSRTHPYAPYDDLEGEVLGSKQDIIDNLNLTGHNRSGPNEYIYAWVAPYGSYDEDIDIMTSNGQYLISRLFYYNDNSFSNWDNVLYKFDPVATTIEVGNNYYWASYDIDELNSAFENVINSSGVYHLVTHPNILVWDQDYTWSHLDYISNKKDLWYVGFGHLYLYRFISKSLLNSDLSASKDPIQSEYYLKEFKNYPNPFNPSTKIHYNISKSIYIKISVIDMMGREVKTLLNEHQEPGLKTIEWDGKNEKGEILASGVYLCQITSAEFYKTNKMIFLK